MTVHLKNFFITSRFNYREFRSVCTLLNIIREEEDGLFTLYNIYIYVSHKLLRDVSRARARASACITRTEYIVYTQGNPFIGAKRKRVPAVIRQTGCIIDRGIEFSLSPSLSLCRCSPSAPHCPPPRDSLSLSLVLVPLPFTPLRSLSLNSLSRFSSLVYIPLFLSRLYSLYSLTLIPLSLSHPLLPIFLFPLFVRPIKSAGYECNEIAINASEYMHSADWLHKISTVCAIFRR